MDEPKFIDEEPEFIDEPATPTPKFVDDTPISSTGSATAIGTPSVAQKAFVEGLNKVKTPVIQPKYPELPQSVLAEDARRIGQGLDKAGQSALSGAEAWVKDLPNQAVNVAKAPIKDIHTRLYEELPKKAQQFTSPQQLGSSSPATAISHGLQWLQDNIGKHVVNTVLNQIDVANQYTEEYKLPGTQVTDTRLTQRKAGKTAAEETLNPTPLMEDIRPKDRVGILKNHPQAEYLMREFLAFYGGDQVRLRSEEALPAINALTQSTFTVPLYGEVPVAAAIASVLHEFGGLPMFLFGTGIGRAATAEARAQLAAGQVTKGGVTIELAPKALEKAGKQVATAEAAIEGHAQSVIGAQRQEGEGSQVAAETIGTLTSAVLGRLSVLGKGGQKYVMGAKAEFHGNDIGMGAPPKTFEALIKDASRVADGEAIKPQSREYTYKKGTKTLVKTPKFTEPGPVPSLENRQWVQKFDTSGDKTIPYGQEGIPLKDKSGDPLVTLSGPMGTDRSPVVTYAARKPLSEFGDKAAPHTAWTTTLDADGNVWIKHLNLNTKYPKSKQSKWVHQRKATEEDLAKIAAAGGKLSKYVVTDKAADVALLDLIHPSLKDPNLDLAVEPIQYKPGMEKTVKLNRYPESTTAIMGSQQTGQLAKNPSNQVEAIVPQQTQQYGQKYAPGMAGEPTVEIAGHDVPWGAEAIANTETGQERIRHRLGPSQETGIITLGAQANRSGMRPAARNQYIETLDFEKPRVAGPAEQRAEGMRRVVGDHHGDLQVELNALQERNAYNRVERSRLPLTKQALRDDILEQRYPSNEEDAIANWGHEDYVPMEGYQDPPGYEEYMVGQMEAIRTTQPIVLHENANGDVVATPVNDGVLDPTVQSPTVKIGDLTELPNGNTAIVIDRKGDTVQLRNTANDQVIKTDANSVVPWSDTDIAPDALGNYSKLLKERNAKAPAEASATPKPSKDLLKLKVLTVDRVMKYEGVNQPAAARMLERFVLEGRVKDLGNGKFEVSSKKVDIPEGSQGTLVYYGKTPDGRGRTGVLRGPDPKKPGNWLIDIVDEDALVPVRTNPVTKLTNERMGPVTPEQNAMGQQLGVEPSSITNKIITKSVDPAKVRTLRPVLWGTAKNSTLPQVYGITKPLPPGIIVMPEHAATQISEYTRLLGKVPNKGPGFKEAFQKYIWNKAFTAPEPVKASIIKLASATSNYKAQKQALIAHLDDLYKGVLSPTDTGIFEIVGKNAATGQGVSLRDKELSNFFAKNPGLHQEVEDTTRRVLERLKTVESELAIHNIKIQHLEDARNMGLLDEYNTNIYARNEMASEQWGKFLAKNDPEVWSNLVKNLLAKRPNANWYNAEDELLGILKMNVEAEQLAAKGNKALSKKLQERLELRKEIQDAIGKLPSAALSMADSLASAESILSRVKTWNAIVESPYWSPGPRPDLGPTNGVLVPNNPIFGKAAGGRVHEAFRHILYPEKLNADTKGLTRAIGAYWKFNVVPAGGIGLWIKEVMRTFKGFAISGTFSEPQDFPTLFDAAEMMLNYKADPTAFGPNAKYLEAMTNGAVSTGQMAKEVAYNRTANRILDSIRKQKGKSKDIYEVMESLGASIRGGTEEIGAAYDAITRLAKFTTYLNRKRFWLNKGMSQNDAAAAATIDTNDGFGNFELVSPVMEKLRGGKIDALAPFLTSTAVDMQINATVVARLAKGDVDLLGRLAAATMVAGGAYAFLQASRRANGITDKERLRALRAPPLSSQAYGVAREVMPSLDDKGRAQIVDFSGYNDLLQLTQMHPLDPVIPSVLRNAFTTVTGPATLTGGLINQATTKIGGLHPLMEDINKFDPGSGGIITFASWVASHGMLPQAPFRAIDIWDRTEEPVNPYKAAQTETWTDRQAKLKMFGFPLAFPVGDKTQVARGKEALYGTKDLIRQGKKALISEEDPAHGEFLLDQKMKAKDELIQNYEESQE